MQTRSSILIPLALAIIVAAALVLSACGSSSSANNDTTGGGFKPATYTATASVGDLILVDIDRDALEMTFTNISYAPTAPITVSYVVNGDASYTIDPGGALETTAWEIEGFGLVTVMHNTGPDLDESSLLVAVKPRNITNLAQFNDRELNLMQFRTSGGGMEVGHVATGTNFPFSLSVSMYRPSDTVEPFHTSVPDEVTGDEVTIEPSNRWLEIDDGEGIVYAVDTDSGMIFIDNPNGSQIALPAAASKEFSPASAGTYRGVIYEKSGITVDEHGVETGTVTVAFLEVVLSETGMLSATNLSTETVLVPADTPVALAPLADNGDYFDGTTDKLANPGHGIFTFSPGSSDVFLAIAEDVILFATYEDRGTDHSYAYGMLMRHYAGVGQVPSASSISEALAQLTP